MSNDVNNHSKKTDQMLRDDFPVVLADVSKQAEQSERFILALGIYEQLLSPYLVTYQHHQGQVAYSPELRERFIAETAILHLLTFSLKKLLLSIYSDDVSLWPVHLPESHFSWYEIPVDLLQHAMANAYEDIHEMAYLGIELADQCDLLLSEFGARYLGEYYTPPALSNHLIELACFHPTYLLNGAKLVDPACGSGNILSAILIQTLTYVRESLTSAGFDAVRLNLYGFDIQPFAITMTQTVLQYISIALLGFSVVSRLNMPLFPNIKCLDTLANFERFWKKEGGGFCFVVGNPPFMSVKKEPIPFVGAYQEIIKGHPNLYSMFLWWAVKSAAPDAYISFLLPQSILAGPYFSAIREHLEQYTRIQAITRLINRTGVVGNADQQMMVLSLKVSVADEKADFIVLRVARNGDALDHAQAVTLPYHTVSHRMNGEILWQVSDSLVDFEILARLQKKCVELRELGNIFRIGTGNFVWNQHEELLHETEQEATIPLISAASISLYGFEFPYTGKHDTHTRQFAVVSDTVSGKTYSGNVLLIKRTTPTKVGRRLIVGTPQKTFLDQYPQFFIENHVNYVQVKDKRKKLILYGLLGWLNSDLINFVFQLRNGSTQVSVFELALLPINLQLLNDIADLVRIIVQTETTTARNSLIGQLNDKLFDWLGLDEQHRKRIQTVLNMKEK